MHYRHQVSRSNDTNSSSSNERFTRNLSARHWTGMELEDRAIHMSQRLIFVSLHFGHRVDCNIAWRRGSMVRGTRFERVSLGNARGEPRGRHEGWRLSYSDNFHILDKNGISNLNGRNRPSLALAERCWACTTCILSSLFHDILANRSIHRSAAHPAEFTL